MPPIPDSVERTFDIILFGATGYTGKLCAEHITTHLPTDIKWAISGRSLSKLQSLVEELKVLNPTRSPPEIEVAQLDEGDLNALAKRTKLIINTVGPYCLYGEPVIQACVNNGTHYLDVTGEAVWVYEMIEKYHEKAKASGAILSLVTLAHGQKIIPQIGIESAPADLGAFALVSTIREELSVPTAQVIFTLQKISGTVSGGTAATVLAIAEKYTIKQLVQASRPWVFSPVPAPTAPSKPTSGFFGILQVPRLGTLGFSPQASADRAIVHRSWGLVGEGRYYGNKFSFVEHAKARNFAVAVVVKIVFGLLFAAVAFPPARWLLRKIVYGPGEGVAKEAYKKDRLEYAAIGVPDSDTDRVALLKIKYHGGNYYFTGLLLAHGALTILRDETLAKKLGGGVLTPATLGQPLIERLKGVGVEITVDIIEN
ncbi:MAG: hypothetical protein M1814_006702 [Vezdaea aestivalis]|nr:MAG: hypothetical protein M1814_006702 [Vezdaea aestivalis]